MQPPFDLSNWNTGFDNQNIHQSPESSQTSQTPPPLQAGQSQNSMLTHESPQSPQSQVSQPQGSIQSQQIPHSVPLLNKTVSEPEVNDNSVEMISKQVDLVRASRVCKPGPPLASNKRLPNCLLIGDSITLGYLYLFILYIYVCIYICFFIYHIFSNFLNDISYIFHLNLQLQH